MKRPSATRTPPKVTPRPAPKVQSKPIQRAKRESWLGQHGQALRNSGWQLLQQPIASLLTIAVIGIALALPSGLYLLLDNVQMVSATWNTTMHISLFLKPEIDDEQALTVAERLRERREIQNVRVISKADALAEYRALSGFADALDMLPENPLPAVIVIQPFQRAVNAQTLPALLEELQTLDDVEVAQYDMLWLQRLAAMLNIVQRGVLVLAGLLALAVLLVIGNTIRLMIQNRQDEIVITQLFGATDAFIRRPFLYSGFWYGFLGSMVAWGLISGALWLLQAPIQQLANLYYSQFQLVGLNLVATVLLLALGAFLGWLGAWLAVNQHLHAIRPR